MIELKPCLKCDVVPKVMESYRHQYYVECQTVKKCDSCGHTNLCGPVVSFFKTADEAAIAWNLMIYEK